MALAILLLGGYWLFDSLLSGDGSNGADGAPGVGVGGLEDRRPGNESIPGVPFEGAVSVLRGQVLGPRGALADADVRVDLITGTGIESLLRVSSSPAGAFEAVVPRLDELADHEALGATIRVVACAPGFRPRHREVPVPVVRPARIPISLELRSGSRLEGVVHDAEGRAVPGASVQAFEINGDATRTAARADPVNWTHPTAPHRTDAEGRFALPASSADSIVGVRVIDSERGHGWWSAFDGDRDSVVDPVDSVDSVDSITEHEGSAPGAHGDLTLVLDPGHVLEGRVRHPDGTPVRGLRIEVLPSDIRIGQSPITPFGPGRRQAFTWTDGEGRFRVAGLRPGTYLLGTWSDPRSVDATSVEPTTPHATFPSTEPVEWTLDAPGVHVEAVDSDGHPLIGIPISVAPLRSTSQGRELPGEPRTAWTRGPQGEAFLPVEAGFPQLLTLSPPSRPPLEVRLEFPTGTHEVHHRAVLDPSPARGTLTLRVADIDGAAMSDLRVGLLSHITGQGLEGYGALEPDPRGRIRGLPVGTWSLRVEPGLDARGRSHYLPTVVDNVSITETPRELLELDAPVGGQLKIELPVVHPERAVDHRGLPRVELLSSYGLTLELRRPGQGPETPPVRSLGGVLPGETWDHDTWLETGDFEIHVRSPEGWSVTSKVRIRPAVTEHLRIEL